MNIAIAAGHQLTVQAAQDVLQAGGNAVDAAIAAMMMTWVAEPCMSSAGGGAFAMVAINGQSVKLFDFFCQTPRYKRSLEQIEFLPVTIDFGDTQEVFHIGKGSTAVPGAVAGIFELHRHYGSMPMLELAQPAITAAKDGVIVNDFQHFDFDLVSPILKWSERGKAIFFPEGKIAPKGEKIYLPNLADFLEALTREGQALFYKGEIAQKIVQDHQTNGGFLRLEDFENYEVNIRKPLSFTYHDKIIYTNPAPSIGGSIIALTLAEFEQTRTTAYHLSKEYIQCLHHIFEKIDALGKSLTVLHRAVQEWQHKTWGSTTHFNVADRHGNAVSLSTTIGEGCGYFIENADTMLNNMLGEAVLMPNGFHSWQENTRLSSMMSPTIVLDKNYRPEIVMGTGGASRIAFAISQVLHLLIDHHLTVEAAVNAPRVHLEHDVLHVEAGFDDVPNAAQFYQTLKSWQQSSLFFGGVHALKREKDHWTAAGDRRRDGYAMSEI
ncbi:MAG: gamma-glutamyltransferase [Saprospiraceae bacterium]|nr:gamma-glutamyltransferase [Saprospiraceae bacterium]